jgi:hypothetical protein
MRKRNNIFFIALFSIIGIVLILVLGIPLSKDVSRHQQAKHAAFMIKNLGGRVSWNPKHEILETIFRDRAFSRITDIHFTNPTFSDEKWLVLKELPQRFGLQVSGPHVTDTSLEYLKEVELLKYLVLSGTSVTDEGIASLIESLPETTVMFGYLGDPNFREINAHTLSSSSKQN